MNPEDFRTRQTGQVIRTRKGYSAFIPAKLSPLLDYDNQFVLSLDCSWYR